MNDQERPYTDPIVMQRAMKRRFSRRSVLRGAGMGVAGFSLASFLAACGGGGGGSEGGGSNTDVFSQQPGDTVNFENWPLYIDQAKDKSGNVVHPSMDAFTKSTGIDVNYNDGIQSNEEFFGKIQPQLANGDPIPYDIIVITNGTQFNVLVANDWIYTLDHSKTPNFNDNAESYAADPSYDAGAKHSMAWQGGFTGVGYNTEKVSRPIRSMDDLANPDVVGKNSVGMLKSDMPDFVMINLGIDPTKSGPDEWKEAANWLDKQKQSGTVRQYYDQGYIDDFTAGNTSATMAWSGDVLYNKYWAGYPQLDFIIPEGGALQWQDNMMIPVGAANPAGALELMDWVYKPNIATEITEWVIYLSPVKGVQDLIMQDAQAAADDGSKGYANKLLSTAKSPYAFPDDTILSQTKFGTNITSDSQLEEWNSIFLPISQG